MLKQFDIHIQINYLHFIVHSTYKKSRNVKPKTVHNCRKHRKKPLWPCIRQDFLDITSKAQYKKEKSDTTSSKLMFLLFKNTLLKEWKDEPLTGGTICKLLSDKKLISRINSQTMTEVQF